MRTSLAIQCIFLLACMAFCTSIVIPKCRCLRTSKPVSPSLIASVQEFGPRPYCNKREVIVTLKDGKERCLDPETKFTKAVLRRMEELTSWDHITVSQQTTTAAHTA